MRTLLLSLAAAAGVALATPAFAQGFYVGGSGVSIGVGSGSYGHRHRSYDMILIARTHAGPVSLIVLMPTLGAAATSLCAASVGMERWS